MCLKIKKNQKALIAEEDIICYKLLYERGIDNFRTVVYMENIKLGKSYESLILVENGRSNKVSFVSFGLHSYMSLEQAVKTIFSYDVIVECIIPKGSEYYIGKTDRENDSYASNKIKYTDKIVHRFNRN